MSINIRGLPTKPPWKHSYKGEFIDALRDSRSSWTQILTENITKEIDAEILQMVIEEENPKQGAIRLYDAHGNLMS